jgi:LEA14-like dessication related protein
MKHWLLALVALTLSACASLYMNVIPPTVSVADVDLKSLGLFEQKFDLGLRIANPNDFDFKIEAVDFELTLNGRPFARGLTRNTTLVAATSSSVVRVEALTQSRNVIEQVRTLSPDAIRAGVPYHITGRVKIDKTSDWLPFEYKGIYGGKTPIKPRKV